MPGRPSSAPTSGSARPRTSARSSSRARARPTSRSPERPMTHLVSTPRRAPAPPGRARAQGVWGPFRGPPERPMSVRVVLRSAAIAIVIAGCALATRESTPVASPAWTSHVIPEARGEIRVAPDGTRTAVRYKGWTVRDFGAFRTYAYDDARPEPPVQKATMPANVVGDPKTGRALFLNRQKGPCTGCHLVPGADVWPAGGVGPDLSTLGDRKLPDSYLYQQLWDPRVIFPATVMPPWGAQRIFTPEEIVHLAAYLQTLHGPPPTDSDPDHNPFTRRRSTGFGDNLDPTNNPAVIRAEAARAAIERGRATFFRRVGERNHACADCHTPDRGANKFLGGRFLDDVTAGLTRHFPTWRTSQDEIWDMRKRFQWCMTPLGANMLAADAVEYAELELFLTTFDVGKPINAPGIRH